MTQKKTQKRTSSKNTPEPPDDLETEDDEEADRLYDESFYDFDLDPKDEEDTIVDNKPFGDDDRYKSARGWDPYRKEDEKLKKLKEKIRSQQIESWHNILEVRSASEWTTDNDAGDPPEALFGNMWRTGELAILFADTGLGKSILAVQIADALSRGEPVLSEPGAVATGFLKSSPPYEGGVDAVSADGVVLTSRRDTTGADHPTKNHLVAPAKNAGTPPLLRKEGSLRRRSVVYIDFELSQQQWTERYSRRSKDGRRFIDKYKFAKNFHRAQADGDNDLPEVFKSIAEAMYYSIDMTVTEKNAEVLIVDNITWLTSGNLSGSTVAANLMKNFKSLKQTRGISILVIAHTLKLAVQRPLSINDLAGNKHLSNFADNLFAVGQSIHDRTHRYIKHVKPRNTAHDNGSDNVLVCRLEKKRNFPRFEFLHHATELSQISRPYDNTNGDRTRLAALARQLSATGLTQRQIAQRLGIGAATVNRYLNQDEPGSQNQEP